MGHSPENDGREAGILPVFFSLGLFALVSQVLFLRELMVVAWGNELSFGIGLGQWLVGVFAGAMSGARLSGKRNRQFFLFAGILILADLFGLAGILWIRGMVTIAGGMPGSALAYGTVFLMAFPPFFLTGFSIGVSFPVAVSIQRSVPLRKHSIVFPASVVYIVEGAGAFVGSLLFTFLLAGRVSTFSVMAFAGVILFAPLLIGRGSQWVVRGIAILMLLLNLSIFLWPGRVLSAWSTELRWRGISSGSLVCSTDSRFQNIEVGRHGGQYQLFEGGRFSFSFPGDPRQRVLAALLMAQHPNPKRVLVLGTLLDGLGTELLRYPIRELDSVVLDSKLVSLLFRFNRRDAKLLGNDRRFHRVVGDGRHFVRSFRCDGEKKFDLVFLNQPEPVSTLLNRFYTVEFFRNVSRILKPDGVIALRMASTVNYTAGDLGRAARTLVETLHSVFPYVVISPESPYTAFASRDKNSISSDPAILAARYRRFRLKPSVMALMFRSIYPKERTRNLMNAIRLRKGSIPLNSDNFPVLSLEFASLTGWYSGSRIARILEWLRQSPWIWVVLLFFFAVFSFGFKGSPRISVLTVAGAAGFSAMALELVVLYVFQVDVGMVYGEVGLLIGLFMTGLPLGAWLGDKWIRGAKNRGFPGLVLRRTILSEMALILLFLFVCQGDWYLSTVGFCLLMVLNGFFTGMVFPAAVALAEGGSGRLVSAAGLVDAADHGGGALGAFLTGGFLLLLLGVPVTLLFLLAVLGIVLFVTFPAGNS